MRATGDARPARRRLRRHERRAHRPAADGRHGVREPRRRTARSRRRRFAREFARRVGHRSASSARCRSTSRRAWRDSSARKGRPAPCRRRARRRRRRSAKRCARSAAARIDVALAGGAECIVSPIEMQLFSLLGVMSKQNEAPESASRPFDARRDGFVMGEGAGFLVLEEREHALARGARIVAELAGYGTACDAYRITDEAPDGRGAVRAMRAAIADAGPRRDRRRLRQRARHVDADERPRRERGHQGRVRRARARGCS